MSLFLISISSNKFMTKQTQVALLSAVVILTVQFPVFSQENVERIYLDAEVTPFYEISLGKHMIDKAHHITVDRDGNIAFYAFYNKQIVYIEKGGGSPLKLIGDGEGRGPREFRGISDIKFNRAGEIWVNDYDNARFSLWNSKGDLLKTVKIKDRVFLPVNFTVCTKTPQEYLYMNSEVYLNDGFLHKVASDGRSELVFGKMAPLLQHNHASGGKPACDEVGNVYFGFSKIGYIQKYSPQGIKIAEAGVPEVAWDENLGNGTYQSGGKRTQRWKKRRMRYITADLHYLEGYLFVGHVELKEHLWMQSLDVYEAEGLTYKGSIKLPSEVSLTKDFVIDEHHIYTIEYDLSTEEEGDLALKVYTYKLPDELKKE